MPGAPFDQLNVRILAQGVLLRILLLEFARPDPSVLETIEASVKRAAAANDAELQDVVAHVTMELNQVRLGLAWERRAPAGS